MRLSQATDFSLRILMVLAHRKSPATVDEISTELGLVKSHVMKIVAKLTKSGILHARRGRSGGVELGRPKDDIKIGDVVRIMEPDFAVVECMKQGKSSCIFMPHCKLKSAMNDARISFLETLDQRNLESIL